MLDLHTFMEWALSSASLVSEETEAQRVETVDPATQLITGGARTWWQDRSQSLSSRTPCVCRLTLTRTHAVPTQRCLHGDFGLDSVTVSVNFTESYMVGSGSHPGDDLSDPFPTFDFTKTKTET